MLIFNENMELENVMLYYRIIKILFYYIIGTDTIHKDNMYTQCENTG